MRKEPFFALRLNIKDRTCSLMDTLANTDTLDKSCRAYTATWNKFAHIHLPQLLSHGTRFTTSSIKHPLQEDGSSCGILVSLFGKCFATGASIDGRYLNRCWKYESSMSQARKEIWETLTDNRDTERCCSCRKHNYSRSKTHQSEHWFVCSVSK